MKKNIQFILCILLLSLVSRSIFANTLVGEGKTCKFIENGLYKPFSDINSGFPVLGAILKGDCIPVSQQVNNMVDKAFQVFLSIVTLVAVVQVSISGIQWMIKDTPQSKTDAKKTLTNSIIGLVLALSSWLILNTVNPKILNSNIDFKANPLANMIQDGADSALAAIEYINSPDFVGPRDIQTPATSDVQGVLGLGSDGERSQDGGLNITMFSSTGDATTDSNTAQARGNRENLLVEGSVALSPDLIRRYKPAPGQEIKVNGVTVGYFDDTTGDNTDPVGKTGVPIINTIDIYNPGGYLGNTNSTLKVVPAGTYTITLGTTIRPQTPNPSH